MEFSKFQKDIFDFIEYGAGNAFVEAVAGSGKTTSIVKGLDFIPITKSILFLAFNKSIADELASRVPMHCLAKTFNSFGSGIVNRALGFRKLNTWKTSNALAEVLGWSRDTKDKDLTKKFYTFKNCTVRLVGLYKAIYPQPFDLETIAERYDVELPSQDNYPDFKDIFEATLGRDIQNKREIDFNDQIFLPIYLNLKLPKYDFVFVDEAQDLNPVQIELVKRLKDQGARVIAVGDRHQAIYGFRGADVMAVENLIIQLEAKILPLSICYRCPKKVVELAKEDVPQIESSPDAPEGEINVINTKDFKVKVAAKDYVLCRVTAPLVQNCLEQIRMGKKATVRGREIGDNLIALIDKICGNNQGMPIIRFCELMTAYAENESAKLRAKEKDAELAAFEDKIATINCLTENVTLLSQVITTIENIFKEDAEGIVFSTIHKAKGLQAPTIWIIRPELLPHPMAKKPEQRVQEYNLRYVARTRSQMILNIVKDD